MPKLTKEIIDNLIQEAMLQERNITTISEEQIDEPEEWKDDPLAAVDQELVKKDTTKEYDDEERQKVLDAVRQAFGEFEADEIETLASLSESTELNEETSALELADLTALFDKDLTFDRSGDLDNESDKTIALARKTETAIDKLIGAKVAAGDKDGARKLLKSKKKFIQLIAKSKKLRVDPDLAELPIGMPQQAVVASPASSDIERTYIDPQVVRVFDNFFKGANVGDRLKELSDFQNDFFDDKKVKDIPTDKFINGGALLNMLSQLTRETDGSAAGFSMEAFLALMVGGAKTGQSNGAGDFVDGSGNEFSAKYGISKYEAKQAASNFSNKDDVVTYVVGMKTYGPAGQTTKGAPKKGAGGTGYVGYDVNKTEVQRYTYIVFGTFKVKVTKAKEEVSVEPELKSSKEGKITATGGTSTASFNFGTVSDILGKLTKDKRYVVRIGDPSDVSKEFRQIYTERVNQSSNQALQKVLDVYKRLKKIQGASTEFTKAGPEQSMSYAFEIAENYNSLDEDLKGLIGNPTKAAQAGLTENKFEQLDLMIENMVKQFIKGNLNDNN